MECILLAVSVLSALQEKDLQRYLPSIDVHVLQSRRLHSYLLSDKLQAINFKKKKKNLGTHSIYLDSWTKTLKVIFPELVQYKGQNKLERLEETSKGNSFLGILCAKLQWGWSSTKALRSCGYTKVWELGEFWALSSRSHSCTISGKPFNHSCWS